MSYQHLDADECKVCGCYSNSGFDICEDCAIKQFIKYLKEHIEAEHYWFDNWIDEQQEKYLHL